MRNKAEEPVQPDVMFPEVDDPKITDAQLGSLVRRYEGLIRPPLVVQVRPRWFDILQVVAVLLVGGVFFVGSVVLLDRTYGNREYSKDLLHVLCDPGRIPEIRDADERTKAICEVNQ